MMMNPPLMFKNIIWIIMISLMTPSMFMIIYTSKTVIIEWTIMMLTNTNITIPIMFDPKGMIFSMTVLFITSNVLHFSIMYMESETHIKRFTVLIIMFVLSMNLLIFIPHMMALLLGWDGLGIISFVLVIFYQNPKSLGAGMITALTNRIGDVMILLSIGWTAMTAQWNILNMWQNSSSHMVIIFMTLAAMTKSAQMPFSSWLPAAMAAPTPVSALVHSSTLVTAGVFIIIRFYYFLSSMIMFNKTLLIISSMTMFMASMSAMAECDLKKIIALSTLSQLGIMMASISLNLVNLAFFHLLTHALFKALLFICAGTLIFFSHHSQDLRNMGSMMNQMPLMISSMLIANMALCGFPFMAGFYSKDLIIEMMLFNNSNFAIVMLFSIATVLTTSYSLRMTFTAITTPFMSPPMNYTADKDMNNIMPSMLLSFGAITSGATINWIMLSPIKEPVLDPTMKCVPMFLVLMGIMISINTLENSSLMIKMPMYNSMNSTMWFMAPLSTQMILPKTMKFSHLLYKNIDQGWMELISAQGISMTIKNMMKMIMMWQKLIISSHLTLMMMFLMYMFM